jgi:hypothetical protein
MEAYV